MRSAFAGALVLGAAACAGAGAGVHGAMIPPPSLAIRNVTVVDVETGVSIPGQTVLIVHDRIVSVEPAGRSRLPRRARVVDGRGKFLVPGLWDMHSHAASYGDTAGHPALSISLAHGVTGMRDMGALHFERIRGWRDDVAADRMIGPRLRIASPIVEHPRWLATVRGWEERAGKDTGWMDARFGPESAEQAVRWVDSVAALGADHVKVRNWPEPAVTRALVARARERGLPVVGHANQPFPLTGVASYEHGFFPALGLSPTGRDSLFRRWAAEGVAIAPTLVASVGRLHPRDSLLARATPAREAKYGFVPPEMLAEWRAELEVAEANEQPIHWAGLYRAGLVDVRELHAAGVRVLAASDFGAPFVVPGFDLHAELQMLVEDVGFSPAEALRAATLNPALVLGMADSLGAVRAGFLADLVLLDGDPLADIRNSRRIRAVVANGRLLDRAALDRMLAEARARVAP